MSRPTLSIFANFKIDSPERLQRMKDSFMSFMQINATKWVVNIRGEYKDDARGYLKEKLEGRLVLFQLDSPQGWFYDSRKMALEIESEFVFFWVEDHICLHLDKVVPTLEEMKSKRLDVLTYSFCHENQARAYYGNEDIVEGVHLDWFEHTCRNNSIIQQNINGGVRLVSCVSIMTNFLFRKILFENKKFVWPKETPFDFEISPTELQFLPLKRAIPRHELFASIDDDNAVPNTCLISRGLYPERVSGPRLTATSSIPFPSHDVMHKLNVEKTIHERSKPDTSETAKYAVDKPNKQTIILINGYRVKEPALPTGLGYIAQALDEAGIGYEVCDVSIHPNDKILKWIQKTSPVYVGLGTMTFEVQKNYELLGAIRESIPEITIILGGPHAIAAGKDIFKECSAVDIVIQGEGEQALVKLLQGLPLHDIPGVLARNPNTDGPAYKPLNIDNISFPKYKKFNLSKYGETMKIASSRGCIYSCTFCGAPKFLGKKWRAFTASRMFQEFKYWYARGYKKFYFSDSLFALDKRRVIDFCRRVTDSGISDVSFTADGVRADNLTIDVLQEMRKANFVSLILGVESVHDKTLEFFKKKETFKQIDRAISNADSLGFEILVYLIIGAPDESYDDAIQSIYYPLKYRNITAAIVSKLVPIKGTPYYEYAIRNKLVANPELCYPDHEAAGFNKKNDSSNPVEKIWKALIPEIETVNNFIKVRNEIKKELIGKGIRNIAVEFLNGMTIEYLSSIESYSEPLTRMFNNIPCVINRKMIHNPKRQIKGHSSDLIANSEDTRCQADPDLTLSSIVKKREPAELLRRLIAANIPVEKTDLNLDEFEQWFHEHIELYDYYQKMGDVLIEKCLEHFIAYRFTQPIKGQVYIDIAAADSNWSECLLKHGIAAYSLDMKYDKGIHGHKIGADATSTGIPDNSIDAMSLQCSFETFFGDNDKLFLKEAGRILKKGGRVVISPLYLDMLHFILSSRRSDLTNAPLDAGAVRIWREDDYNEPFSRHYSPEALANRLLPHLGGLTAKVIYIKNLDQFRCKFPGQRIYCDFILYLSKPHQQLPATATDESSRLYDQNFYDEQKETSYRSAKIVVPIIVRAFKPKSVIDIGCGVGTWLRQFQENGVSDVCGYDINGLSAENYFIDKNLIQTNVDITGNNFKVNSKYDVLICLEVVEHLPAEVADDFVKNLASISQIIIFSGAFPGQTGVNHINEQPPWYWREKFNKLGYVEIDFIRPRILDNDDVSWWYRQNITCYVKPETLSKNPHLSALARTHGQNSSVHKLTIVNEWVLRRLLDPKRLPTDSCRVAKSRNPLVSVIIPTRNRAVRLNDILDSLTRQHYPGDKFEVLVIDNGCTDKTRDVCRYFSDRIQQFKCISEPRPGLHNGRHAGLNQAKGEILVYADDDIQAEPTWLEAIMESFTDSKVAMVGGKIIPRFEGTPPSWVSALSRRTDAGWSLGWYSILDFGDNPHPIPHQYVWGCNFSIRKDVLEKVGGFHPDAFPPELIKYRGDGETFVSEAVCQLGLQAMYNPKAAVRHLVPSSRMTREYIYRRAFNQGISSSYSEFRKSRTLALPRQYAPASNTINDDVDRGMVDGFNYHQQMVRSENEIREWVLKDNYL